MAQLRQILLTKQQISLMLRVRVKDSSVRLLDTSVKLNNVSKNNERYQCGIGYEQINEWVTTWEKRVLQARSVNK